MERTRAEYPLKTTYGWNLSFVMEATIEPTTPPTHTEITCKLCIFEDPFTGSNLAQETMIASMTTSATALKKLKISKSMSVTYLF